MTHTEHTANGLEHDLPYEHGPEPEHAHVLPISLYLKVFGALIFLTGLTVAVSMANLGPVSIGVALLVAMIKAGFVVGFFMHLRYDLKFYSLVFFSALLFVGLFLGLTMVDVSTRSAVNWEEGTFTKKRQEWEKQRAEKWRRQHQRVAPAMRPAARTPDTRPAAPAMTRPAAPAMTRPAAPAMSRPAAPAMIRPAPTDTPR